MKVLAVVLEKMKDVQRAFWREIIVDCDGSHGHFIGSLSADKRRLISS